jgi:hypothetical protein
MANPISGITPGQPPKQAQPHPQQTRQPAKTQTPPPKGDTVTISHQAKQTAPLRTAGSTPQEETKETPIQKTVEAMAGKK